ncbi:TonB-dependent receptor [Bacteroides gallinaceum]|uniref:TonB-dependent receptor n=1 Tax=Bacteroides gallinaceum TaxID=1462571 RepID=A0ABT7X9R4_9BACE|nr:TonB-dependent receptor [Bacteroides gallinaceum]MDN0050797.1 TonB-dependent receptor [Bacteroides gallinaceum]
MDTMKRINILLVLFVYALVGSAQNETKTIELGEVEIKAAKVIHKPDGQIIYPTETQKNASHSGYSILQKLSLPNIRVDEVSQSLSAIDGRGSIQLRINGIIVGREEMLALSPGSISRIDFIDNPGVRYGEGIAYVINILTRRADSGYTVGIDLTQALTVKSGNDLIYGKWNAGNSELSLSYNFGYKDFKGNRTHETAHYLLTDGSTHTIERNDLASRSRNFNNGLQLKYNLADSADYVFQASLKADFSHIPNNYNRKRIIEEDEQYIATQRECNRSSSPVLDLYFFKQLTSRQSLTLNAVGTYIATSLRSSYDEGAPYAYRVEGKTYSLMSEAIYENRLKPFTFTAGANYMQKYTKNKYTGDVNSVNPMHNRSVYAFAEIKGKLGPIRYVAGVGGSYLDYRQQAHDYQYWLFRPKASVAYNPVQAVQLKYDFQISEHVSRVAMISNTSIRNNSMEWTLGNPDIRPNREQAHTFQISYTHPRFQSFVQAYGKRCHQPNMATYIRTEDNRFVYTQLNQKEIDVLNLMLYANGWIVPDKLSIALSGTLFRCFNFGEDYTHCKTFYSGTANVQAYLGKLTLSAFMDSGFRFLEGETEGFNGSFVSLNASYRYKNLNLSLAWQQPFRNRYKQFQSDVYNRYVRKTTALHCRDLGNFVSLNIAWKFSHGRAYKDVRRNIEQKADKDTGILR